ncbi:MAG: class I SAM-dependent methyltransferase [Promethearchaeota archaeon]
MNNPIEDNSVQATMFLPLWGRGTYSQIYPLNDSRASLILDQMISDYNFEVNFIKEFYGDRIEYWGLVFCARAYNMDTALQEYLKTYPNATVVNLGAGLETNFYRNDNGSLNWIDIDLPNVIELRKKYLPDGERHRNLTYDVMDFSWMDEIPFTKENGVFFIAGGFFLYFEEEKVNLLITTLADRFPGGEIIFDGSTKMGVKMTNKRIKKSGKSEMLWKFAFHRNIQKQFESWSKRIIVKDSYSYWERTIVNPHWNDFTKKVIKIADTLKMGRFVHLEFN